MCTATGRESTLRIRLRAQNKQTKVHLGSNAFKLYTCCSCAKKGFEYVCACMCCMARCFKLYTCCLCAKKGFEYVCACMCCMTRRFKQSLIGGGVKC